MLRILNSEELARHAALVPYVEALASAMLSQNRTQWVKTTLLERAPKLAMPGWILFADERGAGVGICPESVVPGTTALRSRIEYVTYMARLAAFLGFEQSSYAVRQVDQQRCPDEWKSYRVQAGDDQLLCALSFPPPRLPSDRSPGVLPHRGVRLGVRGWFPESGMAPGASGEYDTISIQIEEWPDKYTMCVRGGVVMITGNSDSETGIDQKDALGVRVDLGEIEIGLREILSLREGSSIQLANNGPLQCFLRIGATTLATGEITVHNERLLIQVTEVI